MLGAWKMTHSIKYLPCKHENLNLMPRPLPHTRNGDIFL